MVEISRVDKKTEIWLYTRLAVQRRRAPENFGGGHNGYSNIYV